MTARRRRFRPGAFLLALLILAVIAFNVWTFTRPCGDAWWLPYQPQWCTGGAR